MHEIMKSKKDDLNFLGNLGVPEKEQKQTKTSGRFPDLKIFSGTNRVYFDDSRYSLIFSFGGNYCTKFRWKLIFFGGNYFSVEKAMQSINSKKGTTSNLKRSPNPVF
jgi:hypothetical protein